MDNPIFSIIIPVYNIEEYLLQCIDSVKQQDFKDYEVLLVDDGSTDNSPMICDRYAIEDSRVHVVHKKNEGSISARQEATNRAIGDYIVCIDGDDWVEFNYLSSFYQIIERSSPDIICCGYILSKKGSDSNKLHANRSGYYSRADIVDEIFPMLIQNKKASYFSPTVWAKAIKRSIFQCQLNAVDKRIKIGEDGACIIPCVYRSNSMEISEKCLYHYRINTSSITKNRKAFRWDGPQLIGEHLQNQVLLSEYDFQEQLSRKICHELFSVVLSQFFQKKRYRDIKAEIVQGLSNLYYINSIEEARFDTFRGKMIVETMKRRWIFPIWLYAKIKHF